MHYKLLFDFHNLREKQGWGFTKLFIDFDKSITQKELISTSTINPSPLIKYWQFDLHGRLNQIQLNSIQLVN